MHRYRRLNRWKDRLPRVTRRQALMVGSWAAGFVLVAAIAANALTPADQQYGCTKTEFDGGFTVNCLAAPNPTGTPSASPSNSPSPTPSPSPSPSGSPTPNPTTPPPTTTPPPSPTPTPTGPTVNCYANLAACGLPNPGNTGPTNTPPVVNGDVTLNVAGAVYANHDVVGCITVLANNVTIRNVRVRGDCFWGIQANNGNTGIQIVDTWVSCGATNGTGIGSSGFTATRVRVSDCENGFNISGAATVRDSYIADLEAGNGAHTDGAQFNQGASNITFRHNTILTPSPGGTSAIIMWDEGNPQNGNVTITENLLGGGTYTLYCARQGPVTNVRIINNRFIGGVKVNGDFVKDPGGAEFGTTNDCVGDHVTQFAGNVRDLTGDPLAAE